MAQGSHLMHPNACIFMSANKSKCVFYRDELHSQEQLCKDSVSGRETWHTRGPFS